MLARTLKLFSLLVCLILPAQASAIGLIIPNNSDVRPFDVESHRVEITVTNNAAVTKVTQVFKNHTSRAIEGQFVFPLPRGATVSDFSLWINGKKTKGAVLDKKQARQIYESIVRRTKDPGLVEYMDGRLFRASIFPIPAGGTQKLELKFGQVLKRRGGLYRYNYPLAAGSDYVTAKTEKDFTLTAKVQSPIPITTAYSPTHKVSLQRDGAKKLLVGTEKFHTELDKDFELYLGYSKETIGLNAMTWDTDGDGGEDPYFMMAIAPRVDSAAHEEIGQTYTFVMDTSGSMNGDKIEQARKTLAYCLEHLEAQDNFNVIRFSTGVETLFNEPQQASDDAKKRGVAFAKGLDAAGGTAISAALEKALAQKPAKGQPHQIIFVTDGIPTVGETQAPKILAQARTKLDSNERLFTFGVGFDVNTRLLDGLANDGRGLSDYVKPGENMEDAVSALYDRISSPVLSDIQIDFGGAKAYDIYPNPTPDLFQGDQVVLFGRHKKAFKKKIKVTGKTGGQKKTYKFGGGKRKEKGGEGEEDVEEYDTAPLEFIPKLWATRKVGFLLDQIRINGEQKELKDEVVRLAKKFGLVTPYTSYLAVDDSELEEAQPQVQNRSGATGNTRSDNVSKFYNFDDTNVEGSLVKPDGHSIRGRAASSPKKRRARKESLSQDLGGFGGFGKSTGESAVQASEATRDLKEADKVAEDNQSTRRWISGKTFALEEGVWVQEGLKSDAKATKVKMYSKKYFQLVQDHPELGKIAKLGDKVLVKLGGTVYRIVPE
ncbi:VIT domain-containing protein [Persicimonas caeni]|nr:VIT domain-containing protein [Persicimonas caeni]